MAYNMPGVFEFEGDLDIRGLTGSFNRLIARHEILRTVFTEDQWGEARQVILPAGDSFTISYQDLRRQPAQTGTLSALVARDLSTPFDLQTGPLLRASLYQLEDNKWVFTYVMHHIIGDGWSMDILIRELLAFYNASRKGEQASLAPLSIQYKDYAAWQQEQLRERPCRLIKLTGWSSLAANYRYWNFPWTRHALL